ncbi:unnamed protein product [Effrenium voratum]|uniref:Uncharacterized protein n=1 Tax=Effrenium voratum TaxID=2562239 RepID=A0AA36HJ73_9DINO|nr:unnamed protein product [Effrenium voratum]
MIAMGRGIQALAVLTGLYSVPAERCRQAAALGEGFAGIEVRAMTNIGLEGFFKDGRSVELENCTAKDVASAVSECSMGVLDSQKRLYVEVRYAAAASRLASRRLTAVLKFLSAGGLPRRRLRGQIRAGQENKVEFYIFEEFPESDL